MIVLEVSDRHFVIELEPSDDLWKVVRSCVGHVPRAITIRILRNPLTSEVFREELKGAGAPEAQANLFQLERPEY